MRLVKCSKCGEKFPKSTMFYVNDSTKYCSECNQEKEEFKKFTDEIKKMYGDDAPYGFIVKRAKELVNSKGLNYLQIYLIMDYMVRIAGKKVTEDLILAVPNYYGATVRLYGDKAKFNTSLDNVNPIEINEIQKVSKVIPKTEKILKINIEDL